MLAIASAFIWMSCQKEGPTGSDIDDVVALPQSNPTSSAATAAADPQNFACENVQEVLVRFNDPGYIKRDEVGVYAKYVGTPPGDKFLKIWWDYENDRRRYQIVDTQAGQPQRDNDQLYDIEILVEHTYDGLKGPTDLTVRVELILEGGTRGCARNRHISVQPPSSSAGSRPCALHPQWQPVDCRTNQWLWSSDRAFPGLVSANANRTLWVGDQHDSIPNTCSLNGAGWVSTNTFVMSGCDMHWYHVGGRLSGNCNGHDGDVVRRLALGPNDCFNY